MFEEAIINAIVQAGSAAVVASILGFFMYKSNILTVNKISDMTSNTIKEQTKAIKDLSLIMYQTQEVLAEIKEVMKKCTVNGEK